MLKINKQSITLTKGDDASLRLVPRYKDKTIYTVQEGDSAIFRLKVGASVKELECVINLENNKIVVNFTPADTKDFEPGIYRYEAELITSLGFHYTFIADQPFILGNEIEQRLSNATSANGNSNGNYPEIDGEIGDEPVVNGDIQPTNPMLDYEELNHLPKLNGKTIKGNHDNAYYGIPTKTSDLDNDSDFVSDDEYVHTDNNYDDTDKGKVDALGTASTYDVAESGNASTSQVVKGDDTRLTDARTPVAHQHSKVDITDFPTNVSAFNNDSGYITNAVNTLINYYLKSETYTKTEVEQLIAAIKQGKFEVVETLPVSPDPNVIYLVPKDPTQTSNAYDEYVYINNAWEKIGDTDIDLSDYVTDEELTTALQNYVTTSAFQTAIANYYTKTETDNLLSNKVDKVSGKGLSTNDYDNTAKGIVDGVTTALAGKVDKVNGKGLSTEDYTTAEKTKLAAISDEANKVTSSSTNGHINIDGVDTTVYDDTVVTTAISGLNENVEDIQDELSTDTSTVEGNPINFSTLSAQNAKSTILSCEPIQDLHGYDKPWVGGAGKNKLPLILDDLKAINTGGTWVGNVYTLYGITATVLVDSDNNVIGIKTNGTASDRFRFKFCEGGTTVYPAYSGCILNGCPSGGNAATYYILLQMGQTPWTNFAQDVGNGATISTIPEGTPIQFFIQISNGVTVNNLTWYPMLRLSTETDPTFAPYTNECSISGRTEIGILGCGVNIANPAYYKDGYVLGTDGSENANASYCITKASAVFANEVYSIKFERNNPSGTDPLRIGIFDLNMNFISRPNIDGTSGTVTMPTNARYIRLSYEKADLYNIQVEKGNQPTTYEPYTKSNDLTISLGQTVYGCTLDVEKGQLSILYKTKSGKIGGVNTDYSNLDYGMVGKADDSADKGNYDYHDTISSMFAFENASGDWNNANKIGKAYMGANLAYYWFGFPKGTTLEDMQTITNDNVICYELATPITIQLTPHTINLLKGVNNISTTGDKITLTYRDGKVATLGDLTSAVDNLDSKIDESKILTDTATGDKYILVVTNGVLSVQQISN